jgi:hypothetical protein
MGLGLFAVAVVVVSAPAIKASSNQFFCRYY